MEKTFRTVFDIPAASQPWGLRHYLLTAGSCFSDHIGQKLLDHKFNVLKNPFGVIFNPVSLCQLIALASQDQLPDEGGVAEAHGQWHHFQLHSDFSGSSPAALQIQIGKVFARTHQFLQKTNALLLTFGTAWAYRLKETGKIVANCHKQPSALFEKQLLTTTEIMIAFEEMKAHLPPKTPILLTVSPVRHEKDTMPLNAVSKSTLRLACHQLAEKHPEVHYFPAYELLLDDLRDYRFYQPDMLHPSLEAVDYIWGKFAHTWLDSPSQKFIQKWHKIRQALGHRPFQRQSAAHRQFLENLLVQLQSISEVDVSAEIAEVRGRMEG